MAKRKKKSKIKIIVFIIILLILILTVALTILLSQPTEEEQAKAKLEYINNSDEWDENTIFPEYAAPLGRAYEGDLTIKDIGKSMYYVAKEVLPSYYETLKDASNDEISKYYTEHEEAIKINLGIKKQEKFVNLIKTLQGLTGDTISWESYRIDKDTINVGANYTYACLYVTYSGNSEICLKVTINNIVNNKYSTLEYGV